jgi:hypothetical protein
MDARAHAAEFSEVYSMWSFDASSIH